jgi:hypothetical protein
MSGLTKDELKKQGRERADRALSYRKQGLTYKWICKEMNISYSRARQLVEIAERNSTWTQDHWTEYERSIAAAEREACAKLCDALKNPIDDPLAPVGQYESGGYITAEFLADAIRARGQQDNG